MADMSRGEVDTSLSVAEDEAVALLAHEEIVAGGGSCH